MHRALCIYKDAGWLITGYFRHTRRDGLELEKFAVRKATEPKRDGAETVLDEAEQAWLREWVGGMKQMPVRVVLAGQETLIKQVRTVGVARTEWSRVAAFEAEQTLPGPLADLEWTWQAREEDGELAIALVAAKAAKVRQWCERVEATGGRLVVIEPLASALLQTYRLTSAVAESDESVLLIGLGERSTSLVWCDGALVFMRTVPTGVAASGSVEALTRRIAGEMLRVRALAEWPKAMRPIQRVRVAGQAAEVFAQTARTIAELKPELLDGLRAVKLAPGMAESVRGEAGRASLLAGLAAPETYSLNLLPAEWCERQTGRGRRRWLAAAAVLLAGALVLPVVQSVRTTSRLEEKQQTLTAALVPLRQAQRQQRAAEASLAAARREQAQWKEWLQQRGAWVAFLAEVQECLWRTEDTWLDQLNVERTLVNGHRQIRVNLQGRWLDAEHVGSNQVTAGRERLGLLFEELGFCQGVRSVEGERFESGEPGVLKFSCELRLEADERL